MARRAWFSFLAALVLFVQYSALAHGVEHVLEPAHHDEPVCELCLAHTSLGAGIIGSLPAWQAPMHALVFNAPIPAASPCCVRPTYQSRSPPLR
jgi:hypothetical protein